MGHIDKLTAHRNSFSSGLQNLKSSVNNSDNWTCLTDKKLINNYKTYNNASKNFQAEMVAIDSSIKKWKLSQAKTIQTSKMSPPDVESVNRKNQIRKTCIKVLQVVGAILAAVGLVMQTVGTFLKFVPFPPTYDVRCLMVLGGGAVAIGGLGLVGIGELLKGIKLGREARLCNSESFKGFLRDVVQIDVDDQGQTQSGMDLLSPELHKIYKNYKTAVNNLPV